MRVIFACAGTGGHVNPAIAIARIILEHEKDSQILFVGTKNGLENKIVKNAGFEIKHISTGKLIRSFTLKNLKAVVNTYKGIGDSKKIISDFKPDLVIGTGGYICGPVMLAAKKLGVPYILHESNAFPGVAVKLLAKKANLVMLGFDEAKERLKRKDNLVYTGTPAKFNEEIFNKLNKEECKKKFGLDNIDKKIILVTCGSQGAKRVNEVVTKMVSSKLSDKYYIVLVTGETTYEEIKNNLEEIEKTKNIDLSKYIKLEKFVFNMDEMYKSVDMCITRAGAMTITELSITKRPSILIPLPSAAENHQYYNAKILEDVNAGKIIEQKDLTEDLLDKTILDMINNDNLDSMSKSFEKINTKTNKEIEFKIYECVEKVMKEKV